MTYCMLLGSRYDLGLLQGHRTAPTVNCHARGLQAKAPSWTKPAVRPDWTNMLVYQGREKDVLTPFGSRTSVTDYQFLYLLGARKCT